MSYLNADVEARGRCRAPLLIRWGFDKGISYRPICTSSHLTSSHGPQIARVATVELTKMSYVHNGR